MFCSVVDFLMALQQGPSNGQAGAPRLAENLEVGLEDLRQLKQMADRLGDMTFLRACLQLLQPSDGPDAIPFS